MSKAPPTATLPPVSRSNAHQNIHSSNNTDGSNVDATGLPSAPAIDYVAVYRQYCAEEGCKANSAFVRYIQDRGGHFSLERLNLGHNYLGSKGLRPVLRMIDLSQTIVSINLEDNGIGNDAVEDLCAVLERHVSITSLNLRRNPLSVVGGKRLLQLAENNPRMTEILMEGTDIFDGLQERIRMALQHNAAVALGSGPQMEANKNSARNGDEPAAAAAAAAAGATTPFSFSAAHGSAKASVGNAEAGGGRRTAASARASRGTAATVPPPKASLQPLPSLSGTLSNAAGDVAAASAGNVASASSTHNGGRFAVTATDATSSASLAGTMRQGWQEAAVGRTQPRPPPPAVASHTTKALPMSKVIDLKTLFAERARLHTEVNRGEASRRAYAVREELQALERHGRPVSEDESGAGAIAATYPGTSAAAAAAGGRGGGVAASTVASTTSVPLLPVLSTDARPSSQQRAEGRSPTPPTPASVRTRANSDAQAGPSSARAAETIISHSHVSPGTNAISSSSNQNGTTAERTQQRAPPPPPTAPSQSAAQHQQQQSSKHPSPPASRPLAHTVEDVLSPSRMMLLTTEEQFAVLFDQGCREYTNRNLDAAYMAWNEAMRLAVNEGQREWMAVVASNLQRLSYELLVEEGASHLEHGALEKAGETFHLALEVAVKAKNAVWERDMRLAKQNVQKALFHRCHEAALLLFSRAQEDARSHDGGAAGVGAGAGDDGADVTEDDYFVLPGTEEMVRHTPAFVREWSCLLLLKEAVGLWVEGTRVVSRLSEVAAAPLRENISEALNLVASFIVQRHFNNSMPTGLLWFGTDAYLYHECVLLSDLWYELVADCEQSLRHPLLSAVCAAQLGELYVATFQLPQALVQLEKMVRYGNQHKVPMLEATGLTLCGRVHLQRANYALAETSLEAALALWSAVQSDPAVRRLMNGNTQGSLALDIAPMDTSAITAGMATTTSITALAATTSTSATSTLMNNNNNNLEGTTSNTQNGGGSAGGSRFRIEAHFPPDAISVLASASRHYKVCMLLQTYRYRDALETLEYSLNVAYSDTLQEKLGRNYHLNPSLDEIAAIAGVLQTSLVFYTLTSRYDWSAAQNAYQVEESLCIWVLAESREMRFVEVNLTSNFKCSMQDLLDSLRQQLCVEPEMALKPDIITELPSRSWQEPLRVLYQACIHPIIGYVRAADPQLLFGDGVITVVPTGLLWLVPYHALLNVKAGDRYLVEEAAIQLAFSATQAAFAALSAERVQRRDVHREVVAVQTDAEHGAAEALFYSAFPPNADRSMREGEVVAAMLRAGQAQVAERQLKRASAAAVSGGASPAAAAAAAARETTIFTNKVEVVENVEALRALLPRARTLHIATATTAAPPMSGSALQLLPLMEERKGRPRAEDEGGLLMNAASPMGDPDIVRAAEIAHMELFAEHVILTNTNMSRQHVRGIRDDVLGLVRSFFGSGVPCVIAGQWCTPDMEPMELFQRFYALWCRPPTTSPEASLRTVTQLASGSRASASTNGADAGSWVGGQSPHAQTRWTGNTNSTHPVSSGEYGNATTDGATGAGATSMAADEEGEVVRHRALLLARSIRRLLAEEPAMRYRPRVWAGYYCVGTGW